MSEKKARVLITGRVQGVWFRAHTRDAARNLDLKGFVRNLPSGQVEAVFQGPDEKVRQAIAWCRQGSPGARVTRVDVEWEEPDAHTDGFNIRY